jgi:hypothetical protein
MARGLRPVTRAEENESTAITSRATSWPKDLPSLRVGWHLPARELEGQVAAAVREMLDDEASVLEAAQKTDIDSRQIDRVLQAAVARRKLLLQQLVETVEPGRRTGERYSLV